MKTIDKHSKMPLHSQLFNILVKHIENNLTKDDKLDPERKICADYQISRTTVRQALEALEHQGYIYRIQGKGNFVAENRIHQDLFRFYSFTTEMENLGMNPHSQITSFEIISAGKKIAQTLKITEGNLVYKIIRNHYANGLPMIHETIYLSCEPFPGFTRDALLGRPLYEALKEKYNTNIAKAEEVLIPILINKLESHYLSVPIGSPGLKIARTSLANEQVVEYSVGIARGDKFEYRVYLENMHLNVKQKQGAD